MLPRLPSIHSGGTLSQAALLLTPPLRFLPETPTHRIHNHHHLNFFRNAQDTGYISANNSPLLFPSLAESRRVPSYTLRATSTPQEIRKVLNTRVSPPECSFNDERRRRADSTTTSHLPTPPVAQGAGPQAKQRSRELRFRASVLL